MRLALIAYSPLRLQTLDDMNRLTGDDFVRYIGCVVGPKGGCQSGDVIGVHEVIFLTFTLQ